MAFTPSEQALTILKDRYLKKGEDWNLMCLRIAKAMGEDKEQTTKFFDILSRALFLPGTPTIVNAGKEGGQFSSCFVLPVDDDIDSIFDAVKNTAKIHKSGGGTGFNFSKLRPRGSPVGNAKGISSGPISFMKVFDEATHQMKQGGVRRGANMGILNISHPDIVKFIKCKDVDGELSNFNISIGMEDFFLEALLEGDGEDWIHVCTFGNKSSTGHKHFAIRKDNDCPELIYDDDNSISYEDLPEEQLGSWPEKTCLRNKEIPRDKYYTVKEIWDLIVHQAHKNGEPGIIFVDRLGPGINATNPCGEQPLLPYEACNLGSIDVSKFALDSEKKDRLHSDIDWGALKQTVEIAVEFLNRALDTNTFPLPEIHKAVHKTRKIGLGIMGWADLLIKLKIRYDSEEAMKLADKLMKMIQRHAEAHSKSLGYKNQALMCIAPTGSISILAGCSSGMEPNFAWIADQHREDFEDVTVVHPLLKEYLDEQELYVPKSDAELKAIHTLPDYFVTADEISPELHVQMLSVFQDNVDAAVSKTTNLPETATEEEVSEIYLLAYHLECKGVTVYRDGCRKGQVLTKTGSRKKEVIEETATPSERPRKLPGYVFKVKIDLDGSIQNAYIIVSLSGSEPYEVFVEGNIRDLDPNAATNLDTITRLISLALRYGAPVSSVISQLEKVSGASIYSLPLKVAGVLKEFQPSDGYEGCPECGAGIRFEEGCTKCTKCAWSKCG